IPPPCPRRSRRAWSMGWSRSPTSCSEPRPGATTACSSPRRRSRPRRNRRSLSCAGHSWACCARYVSCPPRRWPRRWKAWPGQPRRHGAGRAARRRRRRNAQGLAAVNKVSSSKFQVPSREPGRLELGSWNLELGTYMDPHTLARWRLVLGKAAEGHGISCGGNADAERIEHLVGFLFEPGEGPGQGGGGRGGRSPSERSAGLGPSQLTVPDWVDAVNELFPHQSKEVMQRELVRRRGIAELLEKPELLEKIEPNLELVK